MGLGLVGFIAIVRDRQSETVDNAWPCPWRCSVLAWSNDNAFNDDNCRLTYIHYDRRCQNVKRLYVHETQMYERYAMSRYGDRGQRILRECEALLFP